MKLSFMVLSLVFSLTAFAQSQPEDKSKIIKAAETISGETKRMMRKVGRKSMDETCEMTEKNKEVCAKQKAEHEALNKKEEVEGVPGN